MHVCGYVCMCVYVCIYVCTVYIYMCVCIYVCICMHVCMYVSIHIRMYRTITFWFRDPGLAGYMYRRSGFKGLKLADIQNVDSGTPLVDNSKLDSSTMKATN